MSQGAPIATTANAGLQALGTGGQLAIHAWDQIASYLRRTRGEAHAALFAEPNPDPDRGIVDWYDAEGGEATPIAQLPAPQAEAANAELARLVADIQADATRLSASKQPGDRFLGELLAQAMRAVGRDGTITVEEAKGFSTSLHVVEGAELDRGYMSPYFVTDSEKMVSSLESPYVLVTNNRITTLKEILPLLEKIHAAQKPILIVADDIEGEAMQGLVVNRTKGILQVSAIKGPEFGENRLHALQDLAILLGTHVIAGESELMKVNLSELGRCKRAIIGRHRSVLIDAAGKKDDIESRAADIRAHADDPSLDHHERDALRRRLARLAGGVAILRVGGATEPELKERRDRVDDALHATKAAVEEGILPGGGTALVRAAARVRRRALKNRSDSFKQGTEVILQACCAPLRQIVANAGRNPELVLSKVERLRDNQGYDAATERYVDTLDVGIVDPLKVVRSALENSHSAASMLLSVGCTIIDDSPAE